MTASRRTLKILALALALVTLAVSPRALFTRPLQIPRWQSSKRPHVPRHVLPQGAPDVARRADSLRRTRAEIDPLSEEARPACSTRLLGSPVPDSAAVELRKPRYLRLFDDPHRQTSPPA